MPVKKKAAVKKIPKDRPYEGPVQKGYCMKCKKKNTPIVEAVITHMANGRTALKGACKRCGTGMYKIGNFD